MLLSKLRQLRDKTRAYPTGEAADAVGTYCHKETRAGWAGVLQEEPPSGGFLLVLDLYSGRNPDS